MERAQLQSVGSSSSRNLLGQTGFSYVNAFSLTEWVSKDLRTSEESEAAEGTKHALSKIRSSIRDLPLLRFVCERTESGCGRWSGARLLRTGLCWPATG